MVVMVLVVMVMWLSLEAGVVHERHRAGTEGVFFAGARPTRKMGTCDTMGSSLSYSSSGADSSCP